MTKVIYVWPPTFGFHQPLPHTHIVGKHSDTSHDMFFSLNSDIQTWEGHFKTVELKDILSSDETN